jgi:hypothetical protein
VVRVRLFRALPFHDIIDVGPFNRPPGAALGERASLLLLTQVTMLLGVPIANCRIAPTFRSCGEFSVSATANFSQKTSSPSADRF